jgi:hypothetical protein
MPMPLQPLHLFYPGCHVWLDRLGDPQVEEGRPNTSGIASGEHQIYSAIHSRHYSLVPASWYEEDAAADYLVNLGMKPDIPVAVAHLMALDSYLVYSLEELAPGLSAAPWLHSIWEPLLQLALRGEDDSPRLQVHITPGQIYLIAVDAQKIVFFNAFPVLEPMDSLYFILRVLEDWGQQPASCHVRLSGHLLKGSPLFTLLDQYLGQLTFWSGDVAPLSLSNDQPPHQFADLISFAACVL